MVRSICLFIWYCVAVFVWESTGFSQEKAKLSVKSDLRFGTCGPHRSSDVHPGELVSFSASVKGLTPNKGGTLCVETQFEVRKTTGELIGVVQSDRMKHQPSVGSNTMFVVSALAIPDNHPAVDLELWLNFVDANSDEKITEKIPISVKRPSGVFPMNIAYCTEGENGTMVSGRYVEGERVFLNFTLVGAEKFEKVECTLALIPKGAELPIKILEQTVVGIEGKKLAQKQLGQFTFMADETFEGIAKLTVRAGDKSEYSVDIPLSISECIR